MHEINNISDWFYQPKKRIVCIGLTFPPIPNVNLEKYKNIPLEAQTSNEFTQNSRGQGPREKNNMY